MPVKIPEQGKKLLDGKNFACIATIMKDGSPQVTPVWIAREGDVVLINTSVGRTKERNVARDPRVAIAVFDIENPYYKLVLRGRVVAAVRRGAREHIDALSIKYTGRKYAGMKPGERRIMLRIEATSVSL